MAQSSEAAHLLALAAGEIHKERQRSMRVTAAEELLHSIVDLASTPFFQEAGVKASVVRAEPPAVEISFVQEFSVALVYHHDKGFFFLKREVFSSQKEAGEPLRMAFDPVAKVFVTGEADPWTAPTPGKPLPQRHPAAKLLEAAFEAIGLKCESGAFQFIPMD